MFEIWQTNKPPVMIGDASGIDDALDQLDDACRRRHEQAAANGEGTSHIRYWFEVRDDQGPAACLTYAPDTSRPYESVAAVFRAAGEMP
ncbi:hypothetical protein E1287_07405 [Actinomadura sp. KC06]|uniref:hypothetical protein n=1 Tax=Actinomadura sp. KC06 TaxID=2530369 RepID=UPI00104AF3F3|nr:hypothetical protein [Actinomadura sp. KC06]TDD37874.1 hypothetical protein E1287_07405 [Actinomadura sp. KC06]